MTNALPVHRLALGVGARAEAPAAFVRASPLGVDRLEQSYERTGAADACAYDYAAPQFGVTARLE